MTFLNSYRHLFWNVLPIVCPESWSSSGDVVKLPKRKCREFLSKAATGSTSPAGAPRKTFLFTFPCFLTGFLYWWWTHNGWVNGCTHLTGAFDAFPDVSGIETHGVGPLLWIAGFRREWGVQTRTMFLMGPCAATCRCCAICPVDIGAKCDVYDMYCHVAYVKDDIYIYIHSLFLGI